MSNSNPWDDPEFDEFVGHVLAEMAPKLRRSAFTISIVPTDGKGDVKFWVELGAAIMMDKPIVAVVFDDAIVPGKLTLVADEVVRVGKDFATDPRSQKLLQDAIMRTLEKVNNGR